MRRTLALVSLALAVSLSAAQSALAAPLLVTASSGNLAASANFDVVGGMLEVTLTNTSAFDVADPAELLTAVLFNINGVGPLTPESALLAGGSTVFFGSNGGGNVGGEWAYGSGIAAPWGATEGISSAGFGLFGDFNFNGPDLDPPVALNGMNYGITSAGDNLALGNAAVTGGFPLIKNSVVFTLSGIPVGFDPSAAGVITNISFQYGTGLHEPNIPVTTTSNVNVPEPASLSLLGLGLAVAASRLRRRRAA
jgi:hypothetical protein